MIAIAIVPLLEVIDLPPFDLSSGDWWVILLAQVIQMYLARRWLKGGRH